MFRQGSFVREADDNYSHLDCKPLRQDSGGFIALGGIEIKNSTLLVDFTNQLREQGVPLDEAIEQAGELRFLPVMYKIIPPPISSLAIGSKPLSAIEKNV